MHTPLRRFALGLLWLSVWMFAQTSLLAQVPDPAYYFGRTDNFNAAVPAPRQWFGHEVGEWHLSHDRLADYVRMVAGVSDRITFDEYARTHENRPLYLLTITSPRNQQRIEEIRQAHLRLQDPAQNANMSVKDMPVVVWMGYSVHGNEPSGANAAALMTYYLAAAQDKEVQDMLDNTVILLDPCINPDGVQRFAGWVNANRTLRQTSHPAIRELNEPWPRGRSNHYWFDLNRDWLPLQMPESRGRIEKFQAWRPNVLTDHHEMFANSTFFFQPGVPSRRNPLTPALNDVLTAKIGTYHAKALDAIGSLYYSKEQFDDFYYGKGSSYPDAQGCVGILFEQASSRGHAQDSEHGVLRFPFTIRNQVVTSLSTLRAAQEMREELLNYQKNFAAEALKEAAADPVKGYVFGLPEDPARTFHLLDILHRHQIAVYELPADLTADGKKFVKGQAWVVPSDQPQYRLLKGMFMRQTNFTDSLFYDISAWTFPLAFGLQYAELKAKPALGTRCAAPVMPKGSLTGTTQQAVAYVWEWDAYYAPRMLYALQEAGLKAKVFHSGFSTVVNGKPKTFGPGTIAIPTGGMPQPFQNEALAELVRRQAESCGVEAFALSTGLAVDGVDLGTPSASTLAKPSVLLVAGDGVNSLDAGELWHLFDQRYQIPVNIVAPERLNGLNLSAFNTVILADGAYGSITAAGRDNLKNRVRDGATLIVFKGAAQWAAQQGLAMIKFKQEPKMDSTGYYTYAEYERRITAREMAGAIFEATLDITHPLGYGYRQTQVPLFRDNTLFAEKPKNPFAAPLRYTAKPLMAGYLPRASQHLPAESAAILVHSIGSGKVISFMENPCFRAFWLGANKLVANAVFFGPTIQSGTTTR